jgi:guanylate kinase
MKKYLYIIFGAPGSGKSTALDYLKNLQNPKFEKITKQTTRPRRKTDTDEIENVKEVSPDKDIRYTQYGEEYGASSKDIWKNFSTGKNSIIIVNDIRTIRILKQKFGVLAKVVYIHSNIDKEAMISLIQQRYPEMCGLELEKEMEIRVEKINTIYRKYIENTALFDYTILNVDSLESLYKQIDNIICAKSTINIISKSRVGIFIIAGAVCSGKKDLANAMVQMEKERVLSYKKATNRSRNSGDKGELRHLEIEIIEEKFNLKYQKQGYIYGISTLEVWNHLANGEIILLVVSDKNSIQKLIDEFGDICTVLYLHANFRKGEIKQLLGKDNIRPEEIAARLNGIDELFNLYINKTTMFDHVLLNTAEPEDLYDQAFNILDNYCVNA